MLPTDRKYQTKQTVFKGIYWVNRLLQAKVLLGHCKQLHKWQSRVQMVTETNYIQAANFWQYISQHILQLFI